MVNLKCALVGAVALGALAFGSGSASAIPNGLPSDAISSNLQNVRWVCGPFRCFWRPNFYAFYGPRPYAWGPRRWGPRWGAPRLAWRRW